MDQKLSRRDVLQRGTALGVVALVGAAACGKEKKVLYCADTTSLSAADAQIRMSLAYVDHSNDPRKSCANCQQFIPSAPDACGTCKVVKGPINPTGNCKSFLAKPA
jgi:hypothetical protein